MPVKHALLALLAERDLTGYEVKLRFERVLGEFWQLNSGQVYSTLERLRRAGMVSRRSPEAARRSDHAEDGREARAGRVLDPAARPTGARRMDGDADRAAPAGARSALREARLQRADAARRRAA